MAPCLITSTAPCIIPATAPCLIPATAPCRIMLAHRFAEMLKAMFPLATKKELGIMRG